MVKPADSTASRVVCVRTDQEVASEGEFAVLCASVHTVHRSQRLCAASSAVQTRMFANMMLHIVTQIL